MGSRPCLCRIWIRRSRNWTKLGFRGILLYSNLDGSWPDEPRDRPLFRRAEEIGVPILLHPAYPSTYEQTKGYEMAPTLGLMFDTSIDLTRIILSGMLDEFPRLNLVCPRVGGTVPYLIGRMDHQTQVLKRGAEHIRKPPSDYPHVRCSQHSGRETLWAATDRSIRPHHPARSFERNGRAAARHRFL